MFEKWPTLNCSIIVESVWAHWHWLSNCSCMWRIRRSSTMLSSSQEVLLSILAIRCSNIFATSIALYTKCSSLFSSCIKRNKYHLTKLEAFGNEAHTSLGGVNQYLSYMEIKFITQQCCHLILAIKSIYVGAKSISTNRRKSLPCWI